MKVTANIELSLNDRSARVSLFLEIIDPSNVPAKKNHNSMARSKVLSFLIGPTLNTTLIYAVKFPNTVMQFQLYSAFIASELLTNACMSKIIANKSSRYRGRILIVLTPASYDDRKMNCYSIMQNASKKRRGT